MSGSASDLLWAAKELLRFLKASTDDLELEPFKYLKKEAAREDETPAQRLRRKADEMEATDIAIKRLREVVAAFEEGYSDTIEAAISQARETRERVTVKGRGRCRGLRVPSPAWHRLGRERSSKRQSGGNILRGIRRPDESDEVLS
jgi:hypothetical protein